MIIRSPSKIEVAGVEALLEAKEKQKLSKNNALELEEPNVVPEPASLALAAVAIILLIVLRRRVSRDNLRVAPPS